jgi:hypothetical protein
LNCQMSPAEVIAIEVKQYLGANDIKTLVPRVIGQTVEVEARKGRRTGRRHWDEESWFAALSERRGEDEARAARDLYDWTLARGWSQSYGSGMHDAVWVPSFTANGRDYVLGPYTSGRIEVFFKMGGRPRSTTSRRDSSCYAGSTRSRVSLSVPKPSRTGRGFSSSCWRATPPRSTS